VWRRNEHNRDGLFARIAATQERRRNAIEGRQMAFEFDRIVGSKHTFQFDRHLPRSLRQDKSVLVAERDRDSIVD